MEIATVNTTNAKEPDLYILRLNTLLLASGAENFSNMICLNLEFGISNLEFTLNLEFGISNLEFK